VLASDRVMFILFCRPHHMTWHVRQAEEVSARGRTWLQIFGPGLDDVQQAGRRRSSSQSIKWFLGHGPRRNYGRWTYWEKFDYFAVFWGVW
jgi:hypothetical protein